jgi:predicted nicotinamide N-methyase
MALRLERARPLIGDPGRSYLPKDRIEAVATYQVPVTRFAARFGSQAVDGLTPRCSPCSTVWRFRD